MNDTPNEPPSFRDTLYTVDERGARRWVYPTIVRGKFFRARSTVAYFLLFIYLSGPWLRINGRQAFLFKIVERKFTIFGVEFWATDTLYLMLALAILAISLFFFTALLGRVWCGWACPQTVFLEFLFRPIERLIEGNATERRRLDAQPWDGEKILKKGAKGALFVFFSWVLANTFIAYFYGAEPVIEMMGHSPAAHPAAFAMSVFVMGAVLFEFGYFREQFCTVLCPYARFQSVMLDENSLVIGYDPVRGEPRGKLRLKQVNGGDCINCGACVRVCPTGIDIRNGLQLECVNCAGCIDACDEIMESIGKPPGLIRYDSEARLTGGASKFLRPRVIIYVVVLSALWILLGVSLFHRKPFDADIVRRPMASTYFALPDGRLCNPFFLQLSNKTAQPLEYSIRPAEGFPGLEISLPGGAAPIPAEHLQTIPILVNFPPSALTAGKRKLDIIVWTPLGEIASTVTIMGPDQ